MKAEKPTKRKHTHYRHHDRVRTSKGEKFTNIDRKPIVGEHTLAVQQAVRDFKLQQRAELQALRAARLAVIEPEPGSKPKPVPDPAPDPEPEPVDGGAE